jgi:hypothetical protein
MHTLIRLALVLTLFTGGTSAFAKDDFTFGKEFFGGGALYQSSAATCKDVNGINVLNGGDITATCEAGDTLSCTCERTNIWASGTYKNCTSSDTAARSEGISVTCTCNENGTGYHCPAVAGIKTR